MQSYLSWKATKTWVGVLGGAAVAILLGLVGFAIAKVMRLREGAKARDAFEAPSKDGE
jgi:hypothetical protein